MNQKQIDYIGQLLEEGRDLKVTNGLYDESS